MNNRASFTFILLIALIISGCVSSSGGGSSSEGTTRVENSATSVSTGYGRILRANPIILSGNANLAPDTDLATLLNTEQDFITNNTFLIAPCEGLTSCIEVKHDSSSNLFQAPDSKWAFDPSDKRFLEVNLFGHMTRHQSKFHEQLKGFHGSFWPINSQPGFVTALPNAMYIFKAHWNPNRTLNGYSDESTLPNNAAFFPSKFELQFGRDTVHTKVAFSQDPSIIYHEMGHAFNYVLMNTRNVSGALTTRSDLGTLFYDEAGSIGEGLSDWYSYFMNGRTHLGEWAIGRFRKASRPLSERDSLHASGISTDNDSRLSYPNFLTYDPNDPKEAFEDVHYAGQIISHFLVALTEDLTSQCSMSLSNATKNVHFLVAETLSELGDLTSKASDLNANDTVNLDSKNSFLWLNNANQINFRKFAQTLAKKFYSFYSVIGRSNCNGTIYSKDRFESLLDQYGLLLFRTYNTDGNGRLTGHLHTGINLISVNPANRVRTELLSKNLISYDPDTNAAQAFVFDDRAQLISVMQGMQSAGILQDGGISDQINTGNDNLPYNNGNAKISPGEVVGIMLNLYNNSNSVIGGAQVLANDWDHFDSSDKPCNNFEDNFPGLSEGGSNAADCSTTTDDNGVSSEQVRPVCFMEMNNGGTTSWVGQNAFRSHIGLTSNKCLRGSGSTHDCFMRALKGLDFATFSKINPNTTWAKSLVDKNGNPKFQTNNITFFEVSKDIPPGTRFNCRFRVRFGNCDDCYHDTTNSNDDYLDKEYSGAKPFKIFNLQFTVTD